MYGIQLYPLDVLQAASSGVQSSPLNLTLLFYTVIFIDTGIIVYTVPWSRLRVVAD